MHVLQRICWCVRQSCRGDHEPRGINWNQLLEILEVAQKVVLDASFHQDGDDVFLAAGPLAQLPHGRRERGREAVLFRPRRASAFLAVSNVLCILRQGGSTLRTQVMGRAKTVRRQFPRAPTPNTHHL